MDVQKIRTCIALMKVQETNNKHLQSLICAQTDLLHHTIELPKDNANETLQSFATDYIDHVPDFIEAFYSAAEAADIQQFITPFLQIAAENFISPATGSLQGLDVLLHRAYFAHRLIEEVNDHYLVKTGSTLIPMNMTWANLIIHSIIGDSFANELDGAVDKTVSEMMRSPTVFQEERFREFIRNRNTEQWIAAWAHCNCLSNNLGVELKFTSVA